MIKKSDIVREAVREQDWKKALLVAKDFRIGVTQEQRSKMARAYECIVHPDFYRQIGVDIPEAIEQGKAIVKEYAESTRRKNTMMKWDVKHDMAKRVIAIQNFSPRKSTFTAFLPVWTTVASGPMSGIFTCVPTFMLLPPESLSVCQCQ